MNKLIIAFIALGIALALSSNVNAQEQQNIEISANVLQVITFPTVTNISFGDVQTGAVAEIQANIDDGTESSNASDPTAGAIEILGAEQDYIITQSAAAVLSDGAGTPNTLEFTARYFEGDQNRTGDITGGGYTQTGGGTITLDIGGQLEEPSVAGSYDTGNTGGTHLQIEVAYVL